MPAFDGVRRTAEKAVKKGHNAAEKMEAPVWHPGTPYRPVGNFEDGPAMNPPQAGPKKTHKIYLPWRPTGSRPGENPKKI